MMLEKKKIELVHEFLMSRSILLVRTRTASTVINESLIREPPPIQVHFFSFRDDQFKTFSRPVLRTDDFITIRIKITYETV